MMKSIGRWLYAGTPARPATAAKQTQSTVVGEQQAKATYARERAERTAYVARALLKRDGELHGLTQSWGDAPFWRQSEWLLLAETAVTAMEEFDW